MVEQYGYNLQMYAKSGQVSAIREIFFQKGCANIFPFLREAIGKVRTFVNSSGEGTPGLTLLKLWL
jgi:hypothetical protein